MFLSKAKAMKNVSKSNVTSTQEKNKSVAPSKVPTLQQYLEARDYVGAITLLEFELNHPDEKTDKKMQSLWLGYAAFHLGDYQKSLEVYERLLAEPDADPNLHLYVACSQFHLGLYTDAEKSAKKGPSTRLQNRILHQVAVKLNDEIKADTYAQKLTNTPDDLACKAAYLFSRVKFNDAAEIFKKLLAENRDYLAIQVYIALCFYKLDYYDVSLELLQPYMEKFSDSGVGANLKACNIFRLQDGLAAEIVLKPLLDVVAASPNNFENDLVRHNLVVFRGGEDALQVFPPLVDFIPEAKLNLILYYLRQGELNQAYNLSKDLEPTTPPEYVIKGVVHAALVSQSTSTLNHSELAQHYFKLIGASESECDTIPGRQCMASSFFLQGQYDEVLVYLRSIKTFYSSDSTFNYNFGVALARTNNWTEALEAFQAVTNEYFRSEFSFLVWLSKCYIMTGHSREAWELYVRMETSVDSVNLLNIVANTCYKVGSFYYAAKAFDLLERVGGLPEYTQGKLGACAGVFQLVIANRLKRECLRDAAVMLRSNAGLAEAENMYSVIKNWLESTE